MSKPPKRRGGASSYPAVRIGPLPVEIINSVLGTELEPGDVWLSREAHRHIAEDHPDHYPICFPSLAAAIAGPHYLGQALRHADAFELIYRVPGADGRAVLVAVGLELNKFRNYNIKSSYLIGAETVANRRIAKTLKQVVITLLAQND